MERLRPARKAETRKASTARRMSCNGTKQANGMEKKEGREGGGEGGDVELRLETKGRGKDGTNGGEHGVERMRDWSE